MWDASARVNHHAGRVLSFHCTNRKARIVCNDRPDTDDHGIDKGPTTVKVCDSIGSRHISCVAAFSGHPTVERLTDLCNYQRFFPLRDREIERRARVEERWPDWFT
ncbi:hypothetical protein GCM10010136_14490 [Limoniibacter endophyticus]|uniref:Uncharacterized protein n=1 Tax=Limoniibacter endophyticus TaxID=1565040 RepID=A0A8J3DHT0_9HYPH|nr:hypothetical protein GCM10010136_14490 [Limoniibacter endophyticus]